MQKYNKQQNNDYININWHGSLMKEKYIWLLTTNKLKKSLFYLFSSSSLVREEEHISTASEYNITMASASNEFHLLQDGNSSIFFSDVEDSILSYHHY